jgi:hypothetical protein
MKILSFFIVGDEEMNIDIPCKLFIIIMSDREVKFLKLKWIKRTSISIIQPTLKIA